MYQKEHLLDEREIYLMLVFMDMDRSFVRKNQVDKFILN